MSSKKNHMPTWLCALPIFMRLGTGWIMYASNRTRLNRIDDQAHASTEIQSQVRVGVVGVGLGGLGLGGLATF